MKLTLLDMVQDILSSLDSDEVNSISDTVEAMQVARIIRDCYNEIVSRLDPNEFINFFELLASGDTSKPTLMYLPATVDRLDFIRYNKATNDSPSPNLVNLQSLSVPDFLDRIYRFDTSDTNVGAYTISIGTDSIDILYQNDKLPQYYTIFDDRTVVFDTFDISLENTLTKNRSMGYGIIMPTFSFVDTYVPDLDSNLFSLLMQESKAQAFVEIKQTENAKAERKARRQTVHAQKSKKVDHTDPYREFKELPNYGRRTSGMYSVFSTPKAERGN